MDPLWYIPNQDPPVTQDTSNSDGYIRYSAQQWRKIRCPTVVLLDLAVIKIQIETKRPIFAFIYPFSGIEQKHSGSGRSVIALGPIFV